MRKARPSSGKPPLQMPLNRTGYPPDRTGQMLLRVEFPRPKSHFRTGKHANELGPTHHFSTRASQMLTTW